MPLLIRRGPDQFDLVRCRRTPAVLLATLTRAQLIHLARQCDEELLIDEEIAVQVANQMPASHAAVSDAGVADTFPWSEIASPPAQPQGDGTAGDTDPGDCDEMVLVDGDDDSA